MTQQTPFELVVEALLEDGHEIHFKKEDGTIYMRLNSEKMVAVSGVTVDEIGERMSSSSLQAGFKRIDGADEVCQHMWHDLPKRVWANPCPTCGEKTKCANQWHRSTLSPALDPSESCPECGEGYGGGAPEKKRMDEHVE